MKRLGVSVHRGIGVLVPFDLPKDAGERDASRQPSAPCSTDLYEGLAHFQRPVYSGVLLSNKLVEGRLERVLLMRDVMSSLGIASSTCCISRLAKLVFTEMI